MSTRRQDTLAAIAQCLIKDRRRLKRRLKQLSVSVAAVQPGSESTEDHDRWRDLARAVDQSRAIVDARRAAIPSLIPFPPELPVSERRDEIAKLIDRHQVIVLCGETGSGKSTQLPKICLALGRGVFGRIGHTQPRRIAARSLASRVAAELGTELGGTVGYKVRFHDRVRPETSVKLMTDGILLAEIQRDRYLNEYDTLIIDEAHERSLNIDFLLGYLKQLLPKRPDLKLIITSATIDPQRFANHFGAAAGAGASNDSATENAAANANAVGQGQGANPGGVGAAPIIEISGRTYPVEVRYRPPEEEHAGERDDAMQQAISDAVAELAREGPGDLLVFLSGEREIRETAETLRKHHPPSTEVLPLYARQGPAEQARVFQPHGTRRVVLATNVAETSLTVPGIHFVIDPGFARISRYSHRSKVQRLPVERISQASADQRKGRCGRIASGVCIRLYDEDNFAARAEHTEPEIRRSNLAAVILQMKQLGFGEIERFPFVDPPDSRLISDGYRTLEELAAIDAKGDLTPIGKQLARLPVDPRIGRMLLAGAEHHCLRELGIIAAALAVQDPRERPIDQQQAADEIHATFRHPDSDFLGFLNLWEFLEKERRHLTRRKFQRLCKQHFLSWNRVQEWRDTQIQLHELMAEMGYRENRNQTGGKDPARHQAEGTYEEVHRALLTGLLSTIGRKDEQREYQGARGGRFYIHPSSALFAVTPKWIVCAERVETRRDYGRICAKVQPGWIEQAGSHLLKRSYSEPHWQSGAGQVAAFETVTLYGIILFSRRRINYGPINPTEAREVFLRSALVEGDFETRAPFWRHNQELIEYVHQLEAKSRRRDILVDEEGLYAFYQQRLPSGIYSKPQFERWLRKATRKQPKLLHMDLEQVMQQDAQAITGEQFPDRLQIGATELPLEYRFEPGHEADGVTLVLPAMLINQVSPERLQWLVPGLLEARITAMLRGLPKTLRRSFVPMPDTAARVAARLTPSDRPLVRALGEALKALTGVRVPEDAWDEAALPPYLRMKLRLVDLEGRTLAFDDDLPRLKRRLAEGAFGEGQRAPAEPLAAVPGGHSSGRHAPGGTTAGGQRGQPAAVAASGTAVLGSANAAAAWGHVMERDAIRRWDFGALPESVDLDRAGIKLRGWPALVDQGDAVAIRVLDAQHSAAEAMRGGLRRLFMLALGADLRTLRRGFCDTAGGLSRLRLQYAKAPQTGPTRVGSDLADELLAVIFDLTFTEGQPPIRDQACFEQRLKANKPRLFQVAQEVCSLAASILGTYQAVRKRLDGITQIQWMPSVLDMRAHLDSLVYRGFLVQIPFAHLQDYPRYLRALEQRAEKLSQAATRDRERMQALAPLLERWRERVAAAAEAERKDERLDEIHWMLEELRVSLFAQQLGTAYPVSVKRIERRWRELGL